MVLVQDYLLAGIPQLVTIFANIPPSELSETCHSCHQCKTHCSGFEGLDTFRVESFRKTKLGVDVDDQTTIPAGSFLLHKIDGEFSGEFDQSIVPSFGDDEDTLKIGMNSCAT